MNTATLTPRETEVLTWIQNGKTSFEIGKILGISENTVETYVARVRGKLNASTRSQAVAIAIASKLLS